MPVDVGLFFVSLVFVDVIIYLLHSANVSVTDFLWLALLFSTVCAFGCSLFHVLSVQSRRDLVLFALALLTLLAVWLFSLVGYCYHNLSCLLPSPGSLFVRFIDLLVYSK